MTISNYDIQFTPIYVDSSVIYNEFKNAFTSSVKAYQIHKHKVGILINELLLFTICL